MDQRERGAPLQPIGKRRDPIFNWGIRDVSVTARFGGRVAVTFIIERRIEEDSIEDTIVRVFIERIA